MGETCDKIFLVMLNDIAMDILNKHLSRKQKAYLRNKHKYSLEKKLEIFQAIKEEINAKAEREKVKKLLRRSNKSRPRSEKHTLPIRNTQTTILEGML